MDLAGGFNRPEPRRLLPKELPDGEQLLATPRAKSRTTSEPIGVLIKSAADRAEATLLSVLHTTSLD
ncbi:hypothetical protein [Modicisalibacter sp. MOD 31.J]|uniref:hypothetical protein n=1 Tax=Modicisalibacter sp. MOD 31.J TaxID=2831897 RepID=UPI001CC94083|nr:hypothetical protein [Modicisalibacter sp. MOD 31.J]MBZ9574522.1 hypothetical protein [Modicisalibacter sp. MOD 31.J]